MEDIEEAKEVLLSFHPFNTVNKTVEKLGRLKNVNVEVDKVQLCDCIRVFFQSKRPSMIYQEKMIVRQVQLQQEATRWKASCLFLVLCYLLPMAEPKNPYCLNKFVK
jgi:hypothetical protein